MQTGTSIPPARRRRTTVTPSRSGIVTSRTMTAGGWRATDSSASLPPAAVATAKPSRRSARSRACRTDASSSTTRTRGSGVPMRSELLERGLDLGHVDVELRGELGCERVLELLVLGLVALAELVERSLDLAGREAELLREGGREVAFAPIVLLAELVLERLEGGVERGLRDADGLRDVLLGGATSVERVEGGLDLGGAHAELRREPGSDVVVALAAIRMDLPERGVELGLRDAERGGEAGQLVLPPHVGLGELALDLPQRRLERRGGHAELGGEVVEC